MRDQDPTGYIELPGGNYRRAGSEKTATTGFRRRVLCSACRNAPRRLGSLNFDQRNIGSDEVAACALQNYLVRTRGVDWEEHFLTVPNFTVSAVSPGLQAADLVAYLGAYNAPNAGRPELRPYMARVARLQLSWRDEKDRLHRTIRGVSTSKK